ncbi:MAG: sulfatase [Bryobacteraceae bacterium]
MIDRREFLATLAAAPAQAAASRPNFVFILGDDLGWADTGCYGSRLHETPNIDHLAASGMRFTGAYSACPVCSPTRAAIMTGKYPARIGLTDYLPGLQPTDRPLLSVQDLDGLPLSEVTIAQALKEAGYHTFMRGKWHLGEAPPQKFGFDDAAIVNGARRAAANRDQNITEESVRFLRAAPKDRPFLLYLAFTYPHTPIVPVEPHAARFRKKLEGISLPATRLAKERRGNTRLYQDNPDYASVLYAMDENVGRVLAELEAQKLADRTVVVFTSDNGGLCTHGNPEGGPTSNAPLRSGKGWCYEGGIRVPLIVRAPGVTRPGSTSDAPVISTDFYPTMLQLAGLPRRPAQHRDGLSFVPLLQGKSSLGREALYWHYPHHHGSTWAPGAALRAGEWKLIEFYEEGNAELYNLREDLGERRNLAREAPDRTRRLREQLREWQRSVGAKMPQRNPAFKS